jgi:hypothetical protein
LANAGLEYESLVGTLSRDVSDLNRQQSHGTVYLQDFRSKLPQTDVHLDIHSFKPSSDVTEHGYFLSDWSKGEIVILEIPQVTDELLLDNIIETFEEADLNLVRQLGGFENYLSNVAGTLFDTPTILIEVNEDAGQIFNSIALALVVGVQNYLAEISQPASEDEQNNVDGEESDLSPLPPSES